VGLLTQRDLSGLRGLLEASGTVDRVTQHEVVPGRPGAQDDLARVQARTDTQPNAPGTMELLVESHECLPHCRSRAHSPQGVILSGPRDTEDGHDRVADELLDSAAVALEERTHLGEVTNQHSAE
jgi:hypothetical protein